MAYQTEAINENSLASARSIYDSTIENTTSRLSNPNGIKDELAYLKEFSSKLKFQYLEQETRDKFLRLLLIENELNINREDIDTLVTQNAELKQALKDLKREMETVIQSSDTVANDVISLNKAFIARKTDVDETLVGLENLQNELDHLLNSAENENYRTLFNLKKLIDLEDIGLNEAINIADNALEQDSITLKELEHKLEKAETENNRKIRLIETLNANLERLRALSREEASKTHDKDEPEQVYAQWLRGLNALLQEFIPEEIEINAEKNDTHTLSLKNSKVTLDKQFNIQHCTSANSEIRRLMNATNMATGADTKFWRLLEFLSAWIHQEV